MYLEPDACGVLPSQMIVGAIKSGWISADESDIPEENVQPASLDLRLGDVAYRLRCSFLPDRGETVEQALRRFEMGKVDLHADKGGILEQNRPYLVPLAERLQLPSRIRAKANPKSSTGRLDIFTRVITDFNYMFDEIPAGYDGRLYLEIFPRTFTIRVTPGLTLNQLRLMAGRARLNDQMIAELHSSEPIIFRNGLPLAPSQIAVDDGLFLGLHLGPQRGHQPVGLRAKENSDLIDLSKEDCYPIHAFWEEVYSERSDYGARIVLHPEKFYLLLTEDTVRIPPDYAAEMTPYDPTSGELRTHYAGFFDPGFGYDSEIPDFPGSRVALEVRAHDVPFAVKHGQNICRLSFERMLEPPERLYGQAIDSNYQGQEIALSKHFKRTRARSWAQPSLFAADDKWPGGRRS
jgi:dCTP deaminase